jgi:hypothetical protein
MVLFGLDLSLPANSSMARPDLMLSSGKNIVRNQGKNHGT